MRIEHLSIKSATVAIFLMIGVVAIVLSLLAGGYFRKSALDAQMNSLSRVLEVAAGEMLQRIRERSFDLGMKLAHSEKLVRAFTAARPTHRCGNLPEATQSSVHLAADLYLNVTTMRADSKGSRRCQMVC